MGGGDGEGGGCERGGCERGVVRGIGGWESWEHNPDWSWWWWWGLVEGYPGYRPAEEGWWLRGWWGAIPATGWSEQILRLLEAPEELVVGPGGGLSRLQAGLSRY